MCDVAHDLVEVYVGVVDGNCEKRRTKTPCSEFRVVLDEFCKCYNPPLYWIRE